MRLRIMAHHGAIGALIGQERTSTGHGVRAGRRRPDARARLRSAGRDQRVPARPEVARQFGHRTSLAVPLMREGVALGALLIRRIEVRPFSDKQVELLQTFADQAVIAIENVRLFKELEARNPDLTEALEQQTATSEILRVITSSPTDVQPVFDAIVRSARQAVRGLSAVSSGSTAS